MKYIYQLLNKGKLNVEVEADNFGKALAKILKLVYRKELAGKIYHLERAGLSHEISKRHYYLQVLNEERKYFNCYDILLVECINPKNPNLYKEKRKT